MQKKKTKKGLSPHPFTPTIAHNSELYVEIDFERYTEHLSEYDLTDEEVSQLLHALWSIAVAFVEFGFGVHPAQRGCGKPEENKDARLLDSKNALHLELSQHITGRFSNATATEDLPSESGDA